MTDASHPYQKKNENQTQILDLHAHEHTCYIYNMLITYINETVVEMETDERSSHSTFTADGGSD